MRLRMLTSRTGSPDGITVLRYEAGSVCEVPDELAEVFLRAGSAEEDKTLDGLVETKDEPSTPPAEQPRKGKKRRR